MKRRATQVMFALGLLLTIASVAWWVRGAWVTDTFRLFRTRLDDGILTAHLHNAAVDAERIVIMWSYARSRLGPRINPATRVAPAEAEHVAVPGMRVRMYMPTAADPPWRRLGFACRFDHRHWADVGAAKAETVHPIETISGFLSLPTWFAPLCSAAFTIPFAVALRRARRRRLRDAVGLCRACGYDLRGAAHERCPECGAVVTPAAGAPARV